MQRKIKTLLYLKSFAYIGQFFYVKILKVLLIFALIERRNKMYVNKIPVVSKFPDCSALFDKGRCRRLNLYYCQGEQCTFKQTSLEEVDSLKSAYERLASLDILM